MKALDKDRARRYETVNGLARDLERYLAEMPSMLGRCQRRTGYGSSPDGIGLAWRWH